MALKHKGNPNLVDSVDTIDTLKDITPLFQAISSRNLKNVKLLIDAGADVNHQNFPKETAAMYATSFRWYRAIFLLLENGADWRIKNRNGQDLAFFCFLDGPPSASPRFQEDTDYFHKVLAFLKEKGVDLDAAKKAADKHMGRK